MSQKESPLILFDGICKLCNASVRFIIRFEKKKTFKFGTLQSNKAQKILATFSQEIIFDSVLLIENGILYQESSAALRIARKLKYFWILYYFIYIPKWIRDPLYKWIAKNRYHWFGKQEKCMIPNENLKKRFI